MKDAFEIEVIIAMVTAFFSTVWEHTVAAQPRMIELTPYVPIVKMPTNEPVSTWTVKLTHGDVSGGRVQRGRSQSEAQDRKRFAAGNMPSPLVVFSRREGHDQGEDTGDEVGWAREHQRDVSVEAERLDD